MTAENPSSLADVSPGQKLDGTVKKVTLSGAIIDVGMQVDGLLHISDLGQKNVTRVSNVLRQGQELSVWVKRLDRNAGRLSVTMVEPPKYSWTDLEPGLRTAGKVMRLERYGAFVDIGAETDGLVHISEMGHGRVGKPSDVVSEGEAVTVWVKEVDRKSRRISLSMVEPPDVDIRALKPDMPLTGTVVRLESFGAFVDVGAGRDGMIHVTEMGRGYVGNPSEILSVGDEVQVRVLEVDPRRGRISLSMKDLPAEEYQTADDDEPLPSSMELALRVAMEEDGVDFPVDRHSRGRRKKSKRRRDRTQEDIIARTLRSRRD